MSEDSPLSPGRDRALDAFRGLAVIDLIAPLFLLAMAVPFRASYERKLERLGRSAAAWDMAKRYLALIGIGAILSTGQSYALPAWLTLAQLDLLLGVLWALAYAMERRKLEFKLWLSRTGPRRGGSRA